MKKLLEKKDLLIAEMAEMLDQAEAETRSLDVEAYEGKERELEALNATIEKLETRDKGEKVMTNTQMEQRNYQEEVRAMTTSTSANAVPNIIADEIIKKVHERSPLIGMIPAIDNVGDLEFLLEQDEVASEFLGEIETCSPVDLQAFKTVKATDKRNASMTLVSKKLLSNSNAFTMDYITGRIADRVANGLEKSLLKKGDRDTKELTHGVHSVENIINTKKENEIVVEDVLNLVASMKQTYVKGSKFIMNRTMYSKLMCLTDAMGRPFMVNSIVGDTVKQMLLGIEVIISENMDNDTIALVNPEAFRIKYGQPMQVQALQEKYAEVGQIGLLVDTYLDCVLVNADAVSLLNIGTR